MQPNIMHGCIMLGMDWQDRQAETDRLDRLANRREGGFGVLWGRRRVGKTRLLVEWVARRGGVYFVADESTPGLQRQRFAEAVSQVIPGFGEVEYRDWGSLLTRLARDAIRSGVRGPFVVDELPYLVMASPELPATLQRFVDLTSAGAQRIYGIAGKGRIARDYDADFTMVDLKARRTIEETWLASRCGWSPFAGMTVTG